MAVMAREMWTDQRLDDLNERVASLDRRMEAGFAEMREEFRAIRGEMGSEFQAVRGEMRSEFQAVRGEMASMNRTLIQTMVGGFVAMGVGFAGTIATVILTST
jgi:hypothetical protein